MINHQIKPIHSAMLKNLLSLVLFLLCLPAFGQLQKVTHKTFEVGKASTVQFDIYDEFEVQLWASDNIMIETNIKLYEASSGILDHFVKRGRYEIDMEELGETVKMISKDKERRPIKFKNEECYEQVTHRVFLPDNFSKASEDSWVRTVDAPEKITKDN